MIITFLDTETTGLDFSKGHRVIEIALLSYELETREKKLSFVKRMNPGRSIDPKAQLVHKISQIDLMGCKKFSDYEPVISKILSKTNLLVAHNMQFDIDFIIGEYSLLGKEAPDVELFCTLENSRWATSYGKSANLGELCYACEVDYEPEEAHSALYDTEKLAECFFYGFDNKGFVIKTEG